jgi:tetratricopeptide (TPR) repeat protein
VFHQPPPVNRLSWVSTLSLFLGGGAIASWIFSAWFLATQPSQRFLRRQSLAPIRETELSSRPPIVPSPPTAETLLKAGYSKYIQSDFAEALQKVNQSLMINPNFAEAYYYRSLVQKSLGNHQAAKLDWQLAQRLAPKQMPFNPMFTSLDLALPLDVVGKSPSLPPPNVISRRKAPTAKPTSTSASPYPMPLPSVPLTGDIEAFLELEMKQINQDMLRLKSKINQEPPLPAPKNLPPL